MRNDATVASALLAYRTLFGRVDWSIEPPIGATQQQKIELNSLKLVLQTWSIVGEVLSLRYAHI